MKSNFHILFKTYRDKMQIQSLGKSHINYQTVRKETHAFKQKLMIADDFNDAEEAEMKEQAKKRKAKLQELAENNKLLKKNRKKKNKKSKIKENEMGVDLPSLMESSKRLKKPKKRLKNV